MPAVQNVSPYDLFSHPLSRIVRAGERVAIEESQVVEFQDNDVIVLLPEPKPVPERKVATRGVKKVEVTDAPEVEKRG